MQPYELLKDKVEARAAREREVSRAINHFAGIPEGASNQPLLMPLVLPLPRPPEDIPQPAATPLVDPVFTKWYNSMLSTSTLTTKSPAVEIVSSEPLEESSVSMVAQEDDSDEEF